MKNTIGDNIRRIRLEQSLTQLQLSEKSGVSLSALNKYERNERTPKIETLSMLANALNISPIELTKNDSISFPSLADAISFYSLSSSETELIKDTFSSKTLVMLKFLDMDNFNLKVLSINDIRNLQKALISTAEDFYNKLDKSE